MIASNTHFTVGYPAVSPCLCSIDAVVRPAFREMSPNAMSGCGVLLFMAFINVITTATLFRYHWTLAVILDEENVGHSIKH